MLSGEEQRFVDYWAKNRDREKKVFRQLLIGLPVGLLFAVPIIINFLSGWNKQATMWARAHGDDNTGVVLAVAVLIITVFVAIFYKKHKWDRYEQQYRELLGKQNNEQEKAAVDENNHSS
jgi:uncharacterized membrane protein